MGSYARRQVQRLAKDDETPEGVKNTPWLK